MAQPGRRSTKGSALPRSNTSLVIPNTWKWLMGGTQDNGTIRYTGSTVWDHIADGDGGDCGVNQLNPNVVYHSYYSVSLERSTNKGNTWAGLGLPWPPTLAISVLPAGGGIRIDGRHRGCLVAGHPKRCAAVDDSLAWPAQRRVSVRYAGDRRQHAVDRDQCWSHAESMRGRGPGTKTSWPHPLLAISAASPSIRATRSGSG